MVQRSAAWLLFWLAWFGVWFGLVVQEFYAINPDPKRQEKGEQRPSPYAGGVFPVVFEFKPTYPMTPPKVFFGCPVYHPQVREWPVDLLLPPPASLRSLCLDRVLSRFLDLTVSSPRFFTTLSHF